MKIDMTDKTAYGGEVGNSVLFLTGKFKNGYLLGFRSDDPCGCTTNQTKGWMVIDPKKKKIVDRVTTRWYGKYTGEYRQWRREQKENYGRLTRFLDDFGKAPWKMED